MLMFQKRAVAQDAVVSTAKGKNDDDALGSTRSVTIAGDSDVDGVCSGSMSMAKSDERNDVD